MTDKCICKGNWREIVEENQHLIGKMFKDTDGHIHSFFGIVHGDDDYYFGMWGKGKLNLLSCAGPLSSYGFEPL